ncbi:type III-B CRISPR module-associated Cmr3 family protein [Candidatus Oscillochloris fontis]|uniref:type III-B CRISPR module-associated Cmr3 family protein n=1 Tax=Candidatus Oscillochloris fontis TaxID=2496868 RepID=UPI00101BCF8A|nr:type III-B CRISPR module-associated Cmr3 family protein [Candidatus Oscillochloris fontis]
MSEHAEHLWLIEPRDPLIVRDGRPFGPTPGARARTLPFPFPATIAGALRHKAGLLADGSFDRTQSNAVLDYAVRGPLLVQLHETEDATICDWLFPAPADALLLQDGSHTLRRWLAPRDLPSGSTIAMPDGLRPVLPAQYERLKAWSKAPPFWFKQTYDDWLQAPRDDQPDPDQLGIRKLAVNTRMHVVIQPTTQTAQEGALFQTSGLELTPTPAARPQIHQTRRLALAATFAAATPHFPGGVAPLGGERRLMRWSALPNAALPAWPAGLREQIIRQRCCRVLLLTPACFDAGYRPPLTWVRGEVAATLVAAVVPPAQVISGWDMAYQHPNGRYGRPKKTRHLAAAGSVYYVHFAQQADVAAWLDATWMQAVSDKLQDQRDGFGLAAIGAWPSAGCAEEVRQ